jgi:hypothetical protein
MPLSYGAWELARQPLAALAGTARDRVKGQWWTPHVVSEGSRRPTERSKRFVSKRSKRTTLQKDLMQASEASALVSEGSNNQNRDDLGRGDDAADVRGLEVHTILQEHVTQASEESALMSERPNSQDQEDLAQGYEGAGVRKPEAHDPAGGPRVGGGPCAAGDLAQAPADDVEHAGAPDGASQPSATVTTPVRVLPEAIPSTPQMSDDVRAAPKWVPSETASLALRRADERMAAAESFLEEAKRSKRRREAALPEPAALKTHRTERSS